jgi:N-acetylmuramoyl-L-alanine amidase
LRPLLRILFATLFLLPWTSQGAGKTADSTKKPAPKPSAAPAPAAPRVAWKPEYHLRRAYVPMAQVASYYGLLEPKESGRQIILRDASSKLRIEFTRSEKAARIMGWTFYLSFPVVEIKDRPMVSVYDVRNVIDAILHPGERRDPAVLETIVLDPSGGGREIGIKTPHITEKDLTLDVSNRLAAKLSAAGFKVVVTRKDDSTVSPADRQKTATAVSGEAIFLSLRAASGSPATHGFETSTLPPAGTPATSESDSENIDKKFHAGNINDRESLALAAVLQSSVVSSLKIPDLGIRRARFAELRDINLPAAVCRLGHLSNKEEALKLASPEYREAIAENLLAGIRRYAAYLSFNLEKRREEERLRPLQFGNIRAEDTDIDGGSGGERVFLHVPLKAAPGVFVEREKVEVQIYLFERVNNEELDLSTANPPKDEWLSILPDWKATREEILAVTYFRPPFAPPEQKLYGKRAYYGYVARLVYDGKVVDEASFPQNLNRCLFYFTAVFPRR